MQLRKIDLIIEQIPKKPKNIFRSKPRRLTNPAEKNEEDLQKAWTIQTIGVTRPTEKPINAWRTKPKVVRIKIHPMQIPSPTTKTTNTSIPDDNSIGTTTTTTSKSEEIDKIKQSLQSVQTQLKILTKGLELQADQQQSTSVKTINSTQQDKEFAQSFTDMDLNLQTISDKIANQSREINTLISRQSKTENTMNSIENTLQAFMIKSEERQSQTDASFQHFMIKSGEINASNKTSHAILSATSIAFDGCLIIK